MDTHEDPQAKPRAELGSLAVGAAALISASTGLGAGTIVGLLAAPELLPLVLVQSSNQRNATDVASVLLSLLRVVLSWTLVNTVYALKVRPSLLCGRARCGGIDFKQNHPPAYSDFAYLAFTVGMSFAVSETEPTTTAMGRVVLGHALLSLMFGTGVLTVAINLVMNLGQ